MADVQSWVWYSSAPWPGFSLTSQDNLGANGNGLSVSPSTYTTVTLRDANADGILHDADTDDASTAPVDRVMVGGVERTIQEIGAYANSTVVLDGVTYSDRLVAVALFSDGSFAVRLADDWVPEGHYKKVSQITLGTFNDTEYAGAYTANIDSPFICFVAGTRIATPEGLRPVEALRPGDAVLTRDRGVQPILWAGHRQVCGTGAQAPIRFAPGVLGNSRALKLSPQHRVLIRWPPGTARAGQEVLVAAHHLRDAGRIRPAPRPWVSYHHLLLPRHDLLWAEGVSVESLLPTPYSLSLLSPSQRAEILTALPALALDPTAGGPPARPCLGGAEARILCRARSLRNLQGIAA